MNKLTTAAGAPVADNQDIQSAGRRGPQRLRRSDQTSNPAE